MARISNFWKNEKLTLTYQNQLCCGCGACSLSCPTNAISMKQDDEGFLYPQIDDLKCVNCSKCTSVCPILNVNDFDNRIINVFGGYSTDKKVLKASASGGFVTSLSKYIIQQGGIVFGVKYDADMSKTVYGYASTIRELKAFSSSKYVQSDKQEIFKEVKKQLDENRREVLFTGCPCDLAALRLYLNEDYSNLITCEIFCMGTTSAQVLQQYKAIREKKHGSKIIKLNMKSKKNGWYVATLEEQYQNGKKLYQPLYGSQLGHAFETFIRPSCLNCKFRNKNSCSDFRVGDFWGANKNDLFWNEMGVSCVITASDKAEHIMAELIREEFVAQRIIDINRIQNNVSIFENKGEKYFKKREYFARVLKSKGLSEACHATESFSYMFKRMIPLQLQPQIKQFVHHFIDKG